MPPGGYGPAMVEKVSVLRVGITISHDKPSLCYFGFFPTMQILSKKTINYKFISSESLIMPDTDICRVST